MKKYIFYSLIFLSNCIFSSDYKQKIKKKDIGTYFLESSISVGFDVAVTLGIKSIENQYISLIDQPTSQNSKQNNDLIDSALSLSTARHLFSLSFDLAKTIITENNNENINSLYEQSLRTSLLIGTHLAYRYLTK